MEGWITGGFILASGLILFFNLWGRSLENHGYLRYAEIAREMIRSREWVVPHLNGEIFIDKPPLVFWLIAIPSSIHGSVTPLLARLPSALSAWIGVIILFLWGRQIYGSIQSGLIAGGALLSSYQYFFQSRLAKTDMILCLFILLSLYFFFSGYEGSGKRRSLFYALSFFFIGLGTLTKGPFGLSIPLLIMAIFLVKEKKWNQWVSKDFFWGYLILGLTVLTWVFLFIYRVGLGRSIDLVKNNEILTRTAPVYFYFIRIWLEFAPWSILIPFLFIYFWKQKMKGGPPGEPFLLIWFITLFILLTLFKYRTSRYLLPALPPLALMIGGRWQKKMLYFLIPIFLVVSIWHLREYYWIQRDRTYSPGMVLVGELKPLLKESKLFGFQLDSSTIEEVNFYLDPITPLPILKDTENFLELLKRKGQTLVLMPKEKYEEVRIQRHPSMVFIQEFHYKKGKLVLLCPS